MLNNNNKKKFIFRKNNKITLKLINQEEELFFLKVRIRAEIIIKADFFPTLKKCYFSFFSLSSLTNRDLF